MQSQQVLPALHARRFGSANSSEGRRTAAGRRVAARKAASPLVRVVRSAERHASSTCDHMSRSVTLRRTPGEHIRAISTK